ncbi:MAG TPA: hypothetical protein VEJ44_03380, partial [Acidimicrobiales bacterium]|nr:hypothetical protein [Acidimicrobiales bacterium]
MRTLVVAAEHPWPTNSGSRQRLAATLSGLGSRGPVDLFSVVSTARSDFDDPPAEAGVERVGRVAIDDSPRLGGWVRAAPRPSMPFELPAGQRREVRRALGEFASGDYDLVWCFRVRAWVLAGQPDMAPAVVDLDDLEDQKIRARLASASDPPRGVLHAARGGLGRALWTADARRWQRLHGRISQRCAATVVCSELDAARAALPGVHVVPNGYEEPNPPVGRDKVGPEPTLLFHGTLRYPPNADAARFLVTDVAPRLRELLPSVRL